ncbi:MAG: hypothetical protein DRH97_03935 [Chloroflexi bacterium]|nr:MAG: hypothetical protein DRH97_03935 [Chloroflexota bacterium]
MDIKVKAVESPDSKSVQEVEKELLEKHEESLKDGEGEANDTGVEASTEGATTTPEQEEIQPQGEAQESSELSDEDVLSYIGKRYGKEINSFDELMSERESSEELPEDVAAYLKYKKETGRGFNDFQRLQEDFDEMDPDYLLTQYYKATETGLDDDDIDIMLSEFDYDEDLDDESDIKKIKLAKKKVIAKAKGYFEDMKEQYKLPLESSGGESSGIDTEELEAYKRYTESAKTQQELGERRRNWFTEKTNEVFGGEFKGFEFSVDDKSVLYSPQSAEELKTKQSDVMNFLNRFMNDDGLIADAEGYHKAIAVASNPEKFAQFFYEQGKASATEDVTRKMKNIDMSTRNAPEVSTKGGMQIRAINPDSGKGLKIRSIKKK